MTEGSLFEGQSNSYIIYFCRLELYIAIAVHKNKQHTWYLMGLMFLILGSCSPTRNIPEDQYLLNRNRIEIKEVDAGTHELRNHLQQTPNRRLFGFYRFHLRMYNLADRGRETRFRSWLKNTIGEPPAIYDPTLTEHSVRQLELFLQNMGYFNADVEYDVKTRRQRATVTYKVEGNEPYSIRDIKYAIPDKHLAGFVYQDTINSLVQRGERYNSDILHQERQRLTRHLKTLHF